jgi:hypothetical protein
MHENKNIFFSKFWRKPGILIPDLYFYDIKIQTSIKKNLVKNTRGNHKFFRKYIFWKFFWTGPDPTQKNLGRSPLLHEEWAWIIIHARCSCMNRRRELIHARCSCSEQRGRRRRKRRRGKEGWPAMAVVWPAWRAAVVADGGWGGGLSSSPLCFAVLFSSSVFRSLCQQGFFFLFRWRWLKVEAKKGPVVVRGGRCGF